ncbi:hypothetical protein L0F63_004076, partial [Massospora cicadina]
MFRFRKILMIPKHHSVFCSQGYLASSNVISISYSTTPILSPTDPPPLEPGAEKPPNLVKALELVRSNAFSESPANAQMALNSLVAELLKSDIGKAVEMIDYAQKHFIVTPAPETYVQLINALLQAGDWEGFNHWFLQATATHEFVGNPRWKTILDHTLLEDDARLSCTIDLAYALTTVSFELPAHIFSRAQACLDKFGDAKAFSILFSKNDAEKNAAGLDRIFQLKGWDAVLETMTYVQRLKGLRRAKLELLEWAVGNAPNWSSLIQVARYLTVDDVLIYRPEFLVRLLERHLEASPIRQRDGHLNQHYFQLLLLIHRHFTPEWGNELFAILGDMRRLGVGASILGLDLLFSFARLVHSSMADGIEKEDVIAGLADAALAVAPDGYDIGGNLTLVGQEDAAACTKLFHTIEPSPVAFFHILSALNDERQYKKGVAFFLAKQPQLAAVSGESWLGLSAPSYDMAIRMMCSMRDSVGAWRLIAQLLAQRGTLEPLTCAALIDMEAFICGPQPTYPLALHLLKAQFQSGPPSLALGNSVLAIAIGVSPEAITHVLGQFKNHGLEYSACTYRHLIDASLKANDLTQAGFLLGELASSPNMGPDATKLLCRVLYHCFEFCPQAVPGLFQLAESKQLPSSRQLDFLRIRMYSEVEPLDLEKIIPHLDAMEQRSVPTPSMYEKLLETILAIKEYELALEIITRMRAFGALPSETVYQILMESFKPNFIKSEKISTMYSIDYPESNLDFLCRPD